MAEKDQTLKEEEKTSERTAKEKETLKEDASKKEETLKKEDASKKEDTSKKTTESKVDYETKFKESQKEALRLRTKVMEFEKTQKPEEGKETETPDLGELVSKEVQEQIAPLKAQAAKDVVDSFLKNNLEAVDYLKEINELLPNSPGKTIDEKLENAYLIASKDAMKEAGKTEMAFALYQRGQAIVSGGGASSSGTEGSLPLLTQEEKKVAKGMGLTEEAYAKRKLEVKQK